MGNIVVERIHRDVRLPEKKHEDDYGYDLHIDNFPEMGDWEVICVRPGECVVVGTGIRMELPYGLEFQIRSRSGLARRGLMVANAPATIDAGYRGEIFVILRNISGMQIEVSKGMRIAQGVFAKVEVGVTIVEGTVEKETKRGEGGLGSTGER